MNIHNQFGGIYSTSPPWKAEINSHEYITTLAASVKTQETTNAK